MRHCRNQGFATDTFIFSALLLWLPVTGVFTPATAQTPVGGDTSPAIAGLVRDLGDAHFDVRKRAASELRKLGYAAVPALEAAAKSADPEIAATARDILKVARTGITPAWPAELAAKARNYATLDANARQALIRQAVLELKAESAAFLLLCLAEPDDGTAQAVLATLAAAGDDALAARLGELAPKPPLNPGQRRVLAWSEQRRGNGLRALQLLGNDPADAAARAELVNAAVKQLKDKRRDDQWPDILQSAAALAAAVPEDARFLYLEADALVNLKREPEADALCVAALKLAPDSEAPHYLAGDLLGDLGRDLWGEKEWELILHIPPADEIYDTNAHMRLGQLRSRLGQHAAAADSFARGLDLLRTKQVGALAGASEADLEKWIRELRRKAAQAEQDDAPVALEIKPILKAAKQTDYDTALAAVNCGSVFLSIQPLGVRLLDMEAQCWVGWNEAKREVTMMLNGSPASPAQCVAEFPATAPRQVAIMVLDCVYLFALEAGADRARKLARFEFDYEMQVKLRPKGQGCTGNPLKIGDHEYSWAELLKGVQVDYLPETFELELQCPQKESQPAPLKVKLAIPGASRWPPGKPPAKP